MTETTLPTFIQNTIVFIEAFRMAPRLRAIHENYLKELETVGRLLSDYGELEIDLFNCVQVTKVRTFDEVFKIMFKDRGEKRRINKANEIGLAEYERCGFKTEFEQIIAAMHHCRRIRNQYAHAYWHNPGEGLCFVDLEGLARHNQILTDLMEAEFRYVDQPLLDEQEDFFTYTQRLLTYVNFARRKSLGQNVPLPSKPTARRPPPLFLP